MKKFIDKLIGELEKVPTEYSHEEYNKAIWDVIKFTKNFLKNYNNGWIPCSERLPENNKVVLCWVKSTTIASGETYIIGSCDRGFWFLQTYEIGHHHFPVKDYEVVAWQQLPEEYQSPQEPWKDAMMNTFLAGKV